MGHDEQQDATRRQREEDPQRFENIPREVREEQSPSTGEEGSEEDRQQWEKGRDIGKEVGAIPDQADERDRRAREDQLEAPPGD